MNILKSTAGSLIKSLGVVAGIVPAKSALVAVQNIHLSKSDDFVQFIGTDVDVQIQTSAKFAGDEGRFATTVAASRLMPLLKSVSPDQVVTLTSDGAKLVLKIGKSRFTLQTIPSEQFPMFREADNTESFTLSQSALASLIDHVQFAHDGSHQQHHFNGTNFDVIGNTLSAVASDGLRLAVDRTSVDSSSGDQAVIIPRKSLLELRKLLDGDGPVTVSVSPTSARFEFGDVLFLTKIIGAKYVAYERVLAATLTESVTVNRVALLSIMKRCAVIMADERNPGARFKFSPGELKIITRAAHEDGEQILELDYSGPNIEFGLPINQVSDGLSNFSHELVTLNFSEGKPVVMTYSELPDMRYLIAPMRI